MDAKSLLVDRLEALHERLNLADKAIGAAPAFRTAIAEKRDRLARAIKDARPSPGTWHSLASWEESDGILFREALAYLHAKGPLAHRDSGAAPLAGGLIAELCDKLSLGEPPVIAPDADDSFNDFVQIIRLRYPSAGIWDVPVVAHELGHFAAYRLTSWGDGLQRSQKVREFICEYLADNGIEKENAQKRWRHWLNEFFADAFATYCVGPCYAASCLLLRFNVAQACSNENETHPSSAARAAAILEILSEMNRSVANPFRAPPYTIVIERLRLRWSELLASADGDCKIEWVPAMAHKLYQVVRAVAVNARYDNWSYAEATLQSVLTDGTNVPDHRFSTCDLLNAAWLARAGGADPTCINARVLELWREQSQAWGR
jgi:hypothetical protein